MKNLKYCSVLRAVSLLCLYFAALSFFPVFAPWRLAMAVMCAACLAVGLLAFRCESLLPRLLLALLPAAALALEKIGLYMIPPVLGWLLYAIFLIVGKFDIHIDVFRRSFRRELVLAVLILFLGVVDAMVRGTQFMRLDVVAYVSVFFLLEMFALRSMQMGGSYMPPKLRVMTALSVIGIPLLIVGTSYGISLICKASAPFWAALFAPLVRFLISLSVTVFPQEGPPDVTVQPIEYTKPRFLLGLPDTSSSYEDYDDTLMQDVVNNGRHIDSSTSVGIYVFIAFMLVLCAIIIWAIIRRRRLTGEDRELVYEQTEYAPVEGRRRGKAAAPLAPNVRRVRKIYRSYLSLLSSLKMKIGRSDTSQDVLELAQNMPNVDDSERLRELYIAARYGDPNAVTDEQVAEARRCYDDISDGARDNDAPPGPC